MRLDTYLASRGLTSGQFAEAAGIGSRQTIHNYRKGIRFPTPANLRRIEIASAGEVTAQDFLSHYQEARSGGAGARS